MKKRYQDYAGDTLDIRTEDACDHATLTSRCMNEAPIMIDITRSQAKDIIAQLNAWIAGHSEDVS
jgi:hypothetical protein